MVAGHLRIQNGIYQIILNYKDVSGKRRTKSFSTGLRVKGNARKAEEMLQQARMDFVPPDESAKEQKGVDAEDNINSALAVEISLTDAKEQTDNIEYGDSLLLQPTENILFCDYMIYWLNSMETRVDEDTFCGYEYVVKRRIYPYFQEKGYTLAQIVQHPHLIQAFYDYEMKEKKVSANTVHHYHANIREALQLTFKLGIIDSNPADRIDKPKILSSFKATTYNASELSVLFKVFQGDPLELPILFACFYGLRRSEIAGLKWTFIDFERKTLTVGHVVTQAKVKGKYRIIKKDRTKTKSSYRTYPLIPYFEDLLVKKLKQQEHNYKTFADSYNQDFLEYIFVDPLGNLLKPDYYTHHFRLICDKNGLKHIRFHDLRHSCASLLYDGGVDIKGIQDWMGHSSVSTTANIYTHLNYKTKITSANILMGTILGKLSGFEELFLPVKKESDPAAN
nr:site-specific integrase [uncultured Anaerostipes sp.]